MIGLLGNVGSANFKSRIVRWRAWRNSHRALLSMPLGRLPHGKVAAYVVALGAVGTTVSCAFALSVHNYVIEAANRHDRELMEELQFSKDAFRGVTLTALKED